MVEIAVAALVVLIAILAPLLFLPGPGPYFPGPLAQVGWLRYFARWDAYWYINIAQQGYSFHPDGTGSVVFFPLFPLLLRAVIACGVDPIVAGLLIANVCFFAALWMFYRLVLLEFGRTGLARQATALLAFSPGLTWFSLGYSEPLFLLLSIGVIYAVRRGWWPAAGVLGVLAGLARPTSLVLAAPLLLLAAPMVREAWRHRQWSRLSLGLGCVLAPLVGHGLYLCYLQLTFGNWQANHVVELHSWQAEINFDAAALALKTPGVGLHLFDNPSIFREHVSWTWVLFLFVTLFSFVALWEKRAARWLVVFVLGFAALCCAIHQLDGPVYAIARYAAAFFPFYIAAALFAEDRPWAQSATLAASTVGLTITGLMVFAGYHLC